MIAAAGYANGLTVDFAVPDGEEGSNQLATALQASGKKPTST